MISWNLTRRKNCARKRKTKKEREKSGNNSDKEMRNKRMSKFFRINSKRTTMSKTRHVRRNSRKSNRSHPNLKKSLYLLNSNRNPSLQHSNPLTSRVSSRTFSIPQKNESNGLCHKLCVCFNWLKFTKKIGIQFWNSLTRKICAWSARRRISSTTLFHCPGEGFQS